MKKLKNTDRILITSPQGLGDFVAKIPFIRGIKKLCPKSKIILCARAYVKELANYINEVDEWIDFDELFYQKEDQVIDQLQRLQINVVVHLSPQRKNLGPHVLKYAEKAGITQRIGNQDSPLISFLRKRKKHCITHNIKKKRIIPGVHEFEWNLFPLRFFGASREAYSVKMSEQLKASEFKRGDSKYLKEGFNLIIHPGSHGNAKEWPQEKYIRLIDEIKGEGVHILITGSASEKKRLSLMNIEGESVTNLMGRLSLGEFVDLIKDVDGLVAASTGPIHVASLFSTPTLGLFPKQENIGPKVWRPRGENASFLESPNICRACVSKLAEIDPSLCHCMDLIEVSSVKAIIQKWRQSESIIR